MFVLLILHMVMAAVVISALMRSHVYGGHVEMSVLITATVFLIIFTVIANENGRSLELVITSCIGIGLGWLDGRRATRARLNISS